MYCPHCGFNNIDGMRFCVDCGALLPNLDGSTPGAAQSAANGNKGQNAQNAAAQNPDPQQAAADGANRRRVINLGQTPAARPGVYPDFDTQGPDSTGTARPVAYVPDTIVSPDDSFEGIQSPMPAHDTRGRRSTGESRNESRSYTREAREAVLADEDRPRSLVLPILVGVVMGLAAILAFILVMNTCTRREGHVVDPTTQEQPATEGSEQPAPATEEQPEEEPVKKPEPKDSLDAYSWEELAAIANLISGSASEADAFDVAKKYNLMNSDGSIPDTTKTLELLDGTKVPMRIAGIYHDDAAENMHKTGISFLAASAPILHRVHPVDTNEGGWAATEMRTWLNSGTGLLGQFPQELRDVIVPAAKYTNNVGHSTTTDCVSATADTLWIPSVVEVAGTVDWTWSSDASNSGIYNSVMNSEGTQYQIFKDAGATSYMASSALVMNAAGETATSWWLRSCSVSVYNHFRYVGANGDPSLFEDATLSMGVVFGFCL